MMFDKFVKKRKWEKI